MGKDNKKEIQKNNNSVEVKKSKKNKHYIAEKKNIKKGSKKKDNIFKKISKYFKGVYTEFKRVRWTNGKDLVKYSICTVCFVLFFGIYFYAIDWLVLLVRELAK